MRYVVQVAFFIVGATLAILLVHHYKAPVSAQDSIPKANGSRPEPTRYTPPPQALPQQGVVERSDVTPRVGPHDESGAGAESEVIAYSELSRQQKQQLRNAVRRYGTRAQLKQLESLEFDAGWLEEYGALSERFANDRRMALQVLSQEAEKIKASINLGRSSPQFRRWPDEESYLEEGSAFLKTKEPGIHKIGVYGNEPGYNGEVFGVISVHLYEYPALRAALEYKNSFDEQRDLLCLEAYKMVVSALSNPKEE